MGDLFKLLATGSPVALFITAAILLLSIAVSILYAVAFAQGRSISFWPPAIGERPKRPTGYVERPRDESTPSTSASVVEESPSPVVDRGTVLRAASGKIYRVSSAVYGGA